MNVRLSKLRKMDAQLERNDAIGARATLHSVMPRKTSDKKKAARAKAKADKKALRAVPWIETQRIRALVIHRSRGVCEGCLLMPVGGFEALQLDHWLSGSGRRREQQDVTNTWALCGPCHRLRTANRPSVQHWNGLFRLHCIHHGYRVIEHIVHAPVPDKGTRAQPAQAVNSSIRRPVRRGA